MFGTSKRKQVASVFCVEFNCQIVVEVSFCNGDTLAGQFLFELEVVLYALVLASSFAIRREYFIVEAGLYCLILGEAKFLLGNGYFSLIYFSGGNQENFEPVFEAIGLSRCIGLTQGTGKCGGLFSIEGRIIKYGTH